MTERVSITELRRGLGGHLQRIKAGTEIIVTERGKAIARITPIPPTDSYPEEYRELIEEGIIRPGRRNLPDDLWDQPLDADPDGLVLKALLEERESGW